ncbi:hypothetical protein D9V86_09865 [Bacteroidetes/Chlorobi group bacterium ChocPot_Mid]|nr:MAG: hypothetical protein D9V86_09865 [Bacteroidetes/Chlorobi group bacterium ChocPot_Mid]
MFDQRINIEIYKATLKSYGEDLKKNFYEFFQFFWSVIDDAKLIDNWHIKFLCDELQKAAENVINNRPKENDVVINIPPGTTKSNICSVLFPVWCWIRKPSLRFIVSSFSSSLASDFAIKSRDVVLSDEFRIMYPDIVLRMDRNQIMKYENNHKGVRYSVGFNGTITGKHADIILIDDPLKAEDAFSRTKRTHANRIITHTLSRRKRDNKVTLTILIMQRLHEDDPTTEFLKRTKVKHICLPGVLTDYVKPEEVKKNYVNGLLDPVRLDRESLSEAKKELGTFGYASQILQNPVDDETAIFNPQWWQRYHSLPLMTNTIQVWDTAFEKGQHNDYSVCATWGINMNGFYLINIFRDKITFPELVAQSKKQFDIYKPSIVIIEQKASGHSLIQQLKHETKIPIRGYDPQDKDKVVRAHEVSPRIESGQVFLPADATWLDEFLAEHHVFPNGAHDDQVDTTSMALKYLIPKFDKMNNRRIRPLANEKYKETNIDFTGY